MCQIVRPYLVADVGSLGFDGLHRQTELSSNLPTSKAFNQEIQHFAFSFSDATDTLFNVIQIFVDEIPIHVLERGIRVTN